MSTYYANDKYNAVLTAGYSVGQTTLYVSAVPNNVPTIIVAAKGTDNETIFEVTGKTTNSLTGVSRLRGANVDLDAQTPLTCLNNEEFQNQYASIYNQLINGWNELGALTRASDITATLSGDWTDRLQKGDKLWWKSNGTSRYNYIIGISYSAPNTTITITGGYVSAANDSRFESGQTITEPRYSKVENPQGFPEWFNYEASVSASGSMTISNLARFLCVFKIAGKSVTVGHFVQFDTGGTASNIIKVTLPVNAADIDYKWSSGARIRNTVPANSAGFVTVVEADKAYYLDYNAGNFLLTTNRQVSATFTYRF